VACPYCEQGGLYRITILKIGINSFICDGCDTVWLTYDLVGPETGAFVEDIIRWLGSAVTDYRAEFAFHETCDWPNHHAASKGVQTMP